MENAGTADPFQVLGISPDADEEQVRARYLDLVKQYPPDRNPEEFRKIRSAFEAVRDPLLIAARLLEPPGDEAPPWSAAIEAQKRLPPPLSPAFLLSLGNRDENHRHTDEKKENVHE
ncbi:MAG: J domain-containing protein [Pirellulales bacterium]